MSGLFARTSLDPEKDIPDLSSRVIIVTGGNDGIGKETVKQLAKHDPEKLYLCARSSSKAEAAIADISRAVPNAQITFLELDLASFASVKRAADTVLLSVTHLDLLINNAGVMCLPPSLTKDGYEVQFGTNHMGHALFTKLLMPLLSKTASQPGADVRIISLSSAAEKNTIKGGFVPEKCLTPMETEHEIKRYGQSKLANILFTKELARRYPNITSVAIHPGRVQTPLIDHWVNGPGWWPRLVRLSDSIVVPMPVEQGALTQLWAATASRDKVKSGAYYTPGCKEGRESSIGKDATLAEKLWNWQEAEFARKGYS